ncbi:MAG: hypothetical protein HXX13_12745 [Bacteroidetes bacterium]|nr:hypothetical protein [Bacteroidota bacterium]
MKKIVVILMFAVIATFSAKAERFWNSQVSISFQTFYDELSPYGDWLYTNDYGYVWRPFFDRPEDFRPYASNGDWAYTDYGWTWVSDYRWGWAPFHYGRWFFDDYLGWMWIPGTEWAPAWVSWGSYNDYWGWAPLGPNINVNINFNWIAPNTWWTFVPCRHFYGNRWRDYIYDRPVQVNYITNITNIYVDDDRRDNGRWFRGPRVNEVERYNRTRVRRMEVVESDSRENSRIDNGRLTVYRPRIEQERNNYRPSDSRFIENARTSARIGQQNPRSIDPGVNRTRNNDQERSNTRETDKYERRSGVNAGNNGRNSGVGTNGQGRREVNDGRNSQEQRQYQGAERRVSTQSENRKEIGVENRGVGRTNDISGRSANSVQQNNQNVEKRSDNNSSKQKKDVNTEKNNKVEAGRRVEKRDDTRSQSDRELRRR